MSTLASPGVLRRGGERPGRAPGVYEAAVGRPDEVMGEKVGAVIFRPS